jgi:hypothetical protein
LHVGSQLPLPVVQVVFRPHAHMPPSNSEFIAAGSCAAPIALTLKTVRGGRWSPMVCSRRGVYGNAPWKAFAPTTILMKCELSGSIR